MTAKSIYQTTHSCLHKKPPVAYFDLKKNWKLLGYYYTDVKTPFLYTTADTKYSLYLWTKLLPTFRYFLKVILEAVPGIREIKSDHVRSQAAF